MQVLNCTQPHPEILPQDRGDREHRAIHAYMVRGVPTRNRPQSHFCVSLATTTLSRTTSILLYFSLALSGPYTTHRSGLLT